MSLVMAMLMIHHNTCLHKLLVKIFFGGVGYYWIILDENGLHWKLDPYIGLYWILLDEHWMNIDNGCLGPDIPTPSLQTHVTQINRWQQFPFNIWSPFPIS